MTAKLLARASAYAYQDEKHIQEHLQKDKLRLLEFFDNKETQGYLAKHSDGYFILAFRGTEKNYRDIISDIDVRFMKTKTGNLHNGFYRAWERVAHRVERAMIKHANTAATIYVTGHSLGGAIATIAGMELHYHYNVEIFTYGAPRIGNGDYRDNGAVINRFVYHNDIVPRVPFKFLGFRHMPRKMYHINKKGITKYRRDFVNFGIFTRWMFRKQSYEDHKISNYVRKI